MKVVLSESICDNGIFHELFQCFYFVYKLKAVSLMIFFRKYYQNFLYFRLVFHILITFLINDINFLVIVKEGKKKKNTGRKIDRINTLLLLCLISK